MSEVVQMPARETHRTDPHSLESERAILGAILLGPALIWPVMEELQPETFYRPPHRIIYEAMIRCTGLHGNIDLQLVSTVLRNEDNLKKVGGLEYLSKLCHSVPAVANIAAHIKLLQDHASMRTLRGIAETAREKALDPSSQLDDVLQEAEQGLLDLRASRAGDSYEPIGDIAAEVVRAAELGIHQKGPLAGLRTGFDALDDLIVGLGPGDVVYIGGRPSMGKTALGMGILINCVERGDPGAIISLEMRKQQLATRELCRCAKVDLQGFRKGKLSKAEWAGICEAADKMASLPLYIDYGGSLDPIMMRAKARRMHQERGIKILIIDYLQLMHDPQSSRQNRNNEISVISRSIKLLAGELGIPIIVLSQLNREVEKRPNKRPIMADMRDSGAVEQDADLIWMLYRPEYYARMHGKEVPVQDQGRAELQIAKQRNGPVGRINLAFDEKCARFSNWIPN